MPAPDQKPMKFFDVAQAYATGMKAVDEMGITHIQTGLAAKKSVIRQQLDDGKRVLLTAHGKTLAVFEPEPGAVIAACLRETAADTFGAVERALLPFTDIGAFGVSTDSRWRAAEHFRPFHAIGAVAAAVDARPVTQAMIDAARVILPGVAPELIALALDASRAAQATGE